MKTHYIELLKTINKRVVKFVYQTNATLIEVDIALMSKAQRNFNREQVVKLAKLFGALKEELISLWLCDKAIEAVGDDRFVTQEIKKH